MLYPQNGDSFVTIDSVTSPHPVNTHRPTTSIIASHVHLDHTNLDTNGFKELRVTKWQLNHFFDLCQLLAAATNVIISHFIQCLFLFLITPTTTHTHTRLTALCPGLPGWAGTRKVKPMWILLKQVTVSGSGISCAVCKSAPHSRQTTTPAPHHTVFYSPDALPATQPTASKH